MMQGKYMYMYMYTYWLVDSKKAARTSEKNRSEGNQGGRSREQKYVRVRTLFERFLYK